MFLDKVNEDFFSQNVTVTLAVVAFWEGTAYKGTIVNFFKFLFIGNGGFANSSRKNEKKKNKTK